MQLTGYRLPLRIIDHTYIYHSPVMDHLPNNVTIQVHVVTPALPKVLHVTPQGLNYIHAKFIKFASVIIGL